MKQSKMISLMLIVALVSVSLALNSATATANSADTKEKNIIDVNARKDVVKTTSKTETSKPSITLKATGDGSFTAEQFSPFQSINANARILKINNTFTKGKPLIELQNLLNSSAQIKLMLLSGNELTVRDLKSSDTDRLFGGSHAFNSVHAALDVLERPLLFGNSGERAKQSERAGFNMFTAALYLDLLNKCPYHHPAIVDSEILLVLPFAMKFFDKTGMWSASDSTIDKAMNYSKRPMSSLTKNCIEALIDIATYTESTDRLDTTNKIWKSLYDTAAGARLPERVAISDGYANFLNHYPRYGEAKRIYAQSENEFFQNLDLDEAQTALLNAADYYKAAGDFSKAEKFLRSVAHNQKDKAKSGVNSLLRFQKHVDSLTKLSDLYVESKNYEAAIECLNEAVQSYRSNFNDEELVRLERATSPCCSEVNFRLGQVQLKAGRASEALASCAEAVAQIESSLGETAPQLKGPLETLAAVNESLGVGNGEVQRMKARASHVDNVVIENVTPAFDTAIYQSRDAVKLIQENRFEQADAIIKQQIDKLAANETFDSFLASRLIEVSRVYYKKNRTKALNILSKLAALTKVEKDGEEIGEGQLATRTQVIAETILASDSNSDFNWRELGKALYDLAQNSNVFYGGLRGRRGTEDSVTEAHRNLSNLASVGLALRFSGRPTDAEVFERHIMDVSKKESFDWRDAAINLILCQIESGKCEKASQTYAELFPKQLVPQDQLTSKLVTVADAYRLHNDRAHALEMLKEVHACLPPMSNGSANMRANVAMLEFALGLFDEAKKHLEDGRPDSGARPLLNEYYRYALVLEALGNVKEAIPNYLKAASTIRFDGEPPPALARGIALFSTLRSGDAESLALLERALARNSYELESPELSQQIVKVARTQSSYLSDEKSRALIRSIYRHEGKIELAAAVPDANTLGAKFETNSLSKNISVPTDATHRGLQILQLRDRISVDLKNLELDKVADEIIAILEINARMEHSQLYPHPGNRLNELCIKQFNDKKRFDLGLKVLQKAIALEKQRPPQWTPDKGILNYALLSDEYAKDYKDAEALTTADLVLTYFGRHPEDILVDGQGYTCDASLQWLLNTVVSFNDGKSFNSADQLTKKLSEFLSKHVGPKNPIYIELLKAEATTAGARGDKKRQIQLLSDAIKISDWNWGAASSPQLQTVYAAALREQGLNAEAEMIASATRIEVHQPSRGVLFGEHSFSYSGQPQGMYIDSAEPAVVRWLSECRNACGNITEQSQEIEKNLLDLYLVQGKFDSAFDLTSQVLADWKDIEGECSDHQSYYLRQLALICWLQNKKELATDYLKKAESANVFGRSFNQIAIAALYLEMGQREDARRLLLRAADKYRQSPVPDQNFAQCAYLLSELGEKEAVAKLSASYEKATEKYEQVSKVRPGVYMGPSHHGIPLVVAPAYEFRDGEWIRVTRAIEIAKNHLRMAQNRARPDASRIRSRQKELDELKDKLPADAVQIILKNRERQSARESAEAGTAQMKYDSIVKSENERHDYATAWINALKLKP